MNSSEDNTDFDYCRACKASALIGSSRPNFFSLHTENREIAESFRLISGIDLISGDAGKHDALLCYRCQHDLERAIELRQRIIDLDSQFFQPKVNEAAAKLDEIETLVAEIAAATDPQTEDDDTDSDYSLMTSKCSTLTKKFKSSIQLRKRVHDNKPKITSKRNTFDSTRPFKCAYEGCGMYFKTNRAIQTHQRVHSDDPTCICVCGKEFKWRNQVERHKLKFHN